MQTSQMSVCPSVPLGPTLYLIQPSPSLPNPNLPLDPNTTSRTKHTHTHTTPSALNSTPFELHNPKLYGVLKSCTKLCAMKLTLIILSPRVPEL